MLQYTDIAGTGAAKTISPGPRKLEIHLWACPNIDCCHRRRRCPDKDQQTLCHLVSFSRLPAPQCPSTDRPITLEKMSFIRSELTGLTDWPVGFQNAKIHYTQLYYYCNDNTTVPRSYCVCVYYNIVPAVRVMCPMRGKKKGTRIRRKKTSDLVSSNDPRGMGYVFFFFRFPPKTPSHQSQTHAIVRPGATVVYTCMPLRVPKIYT